MMAIETTEPCEVRGQRVNWNGCIGIRDLEDTVTAKEGKKAVRSSHDVPVAQIVSVSALPYQQTVSRERSRPRRDGKSEYEADELSSDDRDVPRQNARRVGREGCSSGMKSAPSVPKRREERE